MMNKKTYIFCVFMLTQMVVDTSKLLAAVSGVLFKGITENGVSKNTFLCGYSSATASAENVSGKDFQTSDCSVHSVLAAGNFDISGGRTLQFFNNFTYWLKEKSRQEQSLQANNPELQADQNALDAKMQSAGWGAMGAYCVLITTNQIAQDTVYQGVLAGASEVKVIVQLWYNGDNLIQLWSQDAVVLKSGQNFTIAVSNDSDDRLKSTFASGTGNTSYLAAVAKSMQPDNRINSDYNAAGNSPRMVRIQVGK